VVVSLDNTPVALKVQAIAADSVLTGSLNGGNAPAMAMQLDPLQRLTGQQGLISGVGVSNRGGTREGVTRTDEVVDVLKPQLAQRDLGINTIKQDFVEQAELIANVFVTFFIVFGLFSIAVGILLIVLIFTMLAAERRSEMGMERAVGAQRRQLIQQFISEGMGYALLAGVVGTALGAVAVLGIAYGIQQAFGDVISISPYIEPQSLIISYSLGVVITFLAVSISSWRVSRLNVVAAVRDIPDSFDAKRSRKLLIWGIVMLIAGPLLIFAAQPGNSLVLFTSGMTLIPFGIAAVASYFGVQPRWVLTLAGLYSLVFWLLPGDWFNALFGTYDGDIEMFFLSGIAIVASSTLVIIQNLDWILSATTRLGSRFTGWLPSVRLAVSYPGANKGRTGMTIAMFSLIVFSLVMVASINENFTAAFLGDDAAAGWEVSVETTRTNPVPDLEAALDAEGFDTSRIGAVGAILEPADASGTQLRNPDDDEWSDYGISVMNQAYLDNAAVSFSGLAEGYDSDDAILKALKTEPDAVVIDSFALPGADNFGPPSGFQLEGATADGTFEAPVIDVQLPDGSMKQVRVIGVISVTVSSLFGLFMGPETADTLFPSMENPLRTYYLQLPDGTDSSTVAKDVERSLLPFGAQAIDIYQDMQDQQQQQRSFLYVMQGFMGLGLVVGVAAVGVIAFRAVVERRQQIGMLRALGFQQVAVARAFVMESAMIVILGVVSGGITGMILAWSLITSDEFSAAEGTPFIIPWTLITITLVTSIVAALLMAWVPARQASRIVPAEALRYE
jgi:putative ABC transport system permease protein